MPRRVLLPSLVLLVLMALGAAPPAGRAATHVVTDPGDTNAPGQLRTLMRDVAQDGDLIVVPPGFTITLAIPPTPFEDANQDGDLDVTRSLSIQGSGPGSSVIDGGGLDRVVDLVGGVTVALSNLTIRNGDAGTESGGGIHSNFIFSHLTLINVLLTGNRGRNGGGVATGGRLVATGVTVHDNQAIPGAGSGFGGGMDLTFSRGAVLTNVTLSGNRAAASGGGLYAQDATLTLTNVTITDNRAEDDGAGGGLGGGLFLSGVATTETLMRNTLVAGNTVGASGASPDCGTTGTAQVTSQGHNLIQALTGCTVIGDTSSNITGQPAGLGPLQENGGPTPTHALLPGSQALEAGDAACASVDQRGVARPQGTACDIGAFERGGALPAAVDLDRDGVPDIVVGAGRGAEPRVRVLSGVTGAELLSFLAYNPERRSGVRVALCDLTRDGAPDVVTAPGSAPLEIRAFDGATGQRLPGPLGGFAPFPAGSRSAGAQIACVDLDGDGTPDILVTAPDAGDTQVRTFSGRDASPLGSAVAFPGFRGEVFLAP